MLEQINEAGASSRAELAWLCAAAVAIWRECVLIQAGGDGDRMRRAMTAGAPAIEADAAALGAEVLVHEILNREGYGDV
ncbi:hypothetical protein CWIS_04940 [Cellulomonas sp. A375-1]|nr:hypothetical protein CWIS_04940 [Cellulomonas sp. A375-1]